MLDLPQCHYWGRLRLEEVFEFFDFPRLFTCSNHTGQRFLVVSTFDDGDVFKWLYLPLSTDRLSSVVDGRVTLYDAFKNPEDGYLFDVTTYISDPAKIEYLFPEQVPDEDLPRQGARLKVKLEDRNYGLGLVDAKLASVASRRETYNIHLYPSDTELPELGSRQLGRILIDVQELVDALGQACEGEPTVKGAIPANILEKTRLNACQIFEGSFGLQLKANNSPDLFNNSLLADALGEFVNLLSTGASEDLISNKLHALKGRVASKYRKLLKDIAELGSPIKAEWASPDSQRGGEIYLDSETIANAYAIVDRIEVDMSEEIIFQGKLLGMDVHTKRYRVEKIDGAQIFAGRVLDEAIPEVEHAEINRIYTVIVKKMIEVNSSSGAEYEKWILVGLRPIIK